MKKLEKLEELENSHFTPGSGQGIGAEAARLFANEGAKVIVSDIDGST